MKQILMTSEELLSEADNTLSKLLQLLSAFNQEQLNLAPFKDSWTAGQVAEHMIKSNAGFVEMLFGPVSETNRPPDELSQQIKTGFMDFTTKMESPDFVVPSNTSHQKTALVYTLTQIKASLLKAIENLELTKTCMAFELPVFGYLTRLEAIYFVIYHTKRHCHQLENIHQKVTHQTG